MIVATTARTARCSVPIDTVLPMYGFIKGFHTHILVYRRKEQQSIWLARVKLQHCEGIVRFTFLQGKVVHPDWRLRGGFDRGDNLTIWL